MLIYACDSTSGTASVALCRDGRLLAQYTQNGGNTHSETLLPMTGTMLKSLGLSVDDIDLFACAAGPGSFTGVRIGVATVKGLAFGKGKPCAGVSTLEALAQNLVSDEERIICPVMDARRGQFYTASFRSIDGKLERLTEDRIIPYSQFETEWRGRGKKIWLCGDGYTLVKSMLPEDGAFNTPEPLIYQSAFSVAQAALRAFGEGRCTDDALLRPIYLRLPQAERERLERLGRQNGDNSAK